MKLKFTIKNLVLFAILLSFSCDDELSNCYETICDGPDNTNCREEPVFDSGCFPMDSEVLKQPIVIEVNDQH